MADSRIARVGDSCGGWRRQGTSVTDTMIERDRGLIWRIQGLMGQGTRVVDSGIEESVDSHCGFGN